MTVDVKKTFADEVKPLWDELPLEEKKLMVEAFSDDIKANLVPLRSWNIDRMIHHAQRQAEIAANLLKSKLTADERQKHDKVIEATKRFYSNTVFLNSIQSLPVAWFFKKSAGYVLVALLSYAVFFADQVLMEKIGLVVGSAVAISGGYVVAAYRRFMQTTGWGNPLFEQVSRVTTVIASAAALMALLGAVNLGIALQ